MGEVDADEGVDIVGRTHVLTCTESDVVGVFDVDGVIGDVVDVVDVADVADVDGRLKWPWCRVLPQRLGTGCLVWSRGSPYI